MQDIVGSLFVHNQGFALPQEYRGLVLAVAVGFILAEFAFGRLSGRPVHDAAETAASFGIALGNAVLRAVEAGFLAISFAFVYRHRLFDIPLDTAWGLLGLLLGTEFFYWLFHFASHNIRWLWATHAVHHSATKLNLTAAVRLGWTGALSGTFLFFLPLAWLGFHPFAVTATLAVSLAYQFFVHTQFGPNLGPLEWVLNTPSHHQVHHACNEGCLNKNYGGVLIVYDRLFGTFAERPKGELTFGLARQIRSNNPVKIALHEWVNIARDTWRATSWRGRWQALFGRP